MAPKITLLEPHFETLQIGAGRGAQAASVDSEVPDHDAGESGARGRSMRRYVAVLAVFGVLGYVGRRRYRSRRDPTDIEFDESTDEADAVIA